MRFTFIHPTESRETKTNHRIKPQAKQDASKTRPFLGIMDQAYHCNMTFLNNGLAYQPNKALKTRSQHGKAGHSGEGSVCLSRFGDPG
jgi:hypothetical protein